jgi:hypothetical protein
MRLNWLGRAGMNNAIRGHGQRYAADWKLNWSNCATSSG